MGSTGIGIAVVVLTELAMSFFSATDAIEETTLATEDFIDTETRLQKIVDDTNTIMNQRYSDTKKGAEDSVDSINDEIKERRKLLAQSKLNLGGFIGNIKVMSNEIQKRDFLKAQLEKDLVYIQEQKLKVAKDLAVTNEKDLKAKNILIKSIEKEISRLNALGVAEKEVIKTKEKDNTLAWAKISLMKEVLAGTKSLTDAERELRDATIQRAEDELALLPYSILISDTRLELEQKIIDLKMKNRKEDEKGDKKAAKNREEHIKDLGDLGSALQTVAGDSKALNGVRKAGEAITKAAAIAESILNLEKTLGIVLEKEGTLATLLGVVATELSTAATAKDTIVTGGGLAVKATDTILSSAKGLGPFGIIAMVAMAAMVMKVMGMFEDGGIISDGKKFADGGMVHGASHAQGGVKFAVGGRVNELEGGEAVINKRSTAMFRNQLSSMNEAGGGVKFADGGLMSSPSFTESSFAASNQSQMMGAMSNQRKVVVVEADITDSQSTVSVIQANSTF